jgi:antitoxin component YwqK of YwqJK toxin-antitoxin module
MKNNFIKSFIILLLTIISFSCSKYRIKYIDEIVLHENIQEVNGIYYNGDCEDHIGSKFSGSGNYFYDNGKIKGTYTLKNGLPHGHWEQFNENGTKKLDLYFENGNLEKKIKTN